MVLFLSKWYQNIQHESEGVFTCKILDVAQKIIFFTFFLAAVSNELAKLMAMFGDKSE